MVSRFTVSDLEISSLSVMKNSLHHRILNYFRLSAYSLLLAAAVIGVSLQAQGRGNSAQARGNQPGNQISSAPTVLPTQAPTVEACALYPITFPMTTLAGLQPGQTLDIYAGSNPGNFGWLSWAGSPNEPTIRKSLEIPGDSHTYVNPHDPFDNVLSAGDWVYGSPGISNSKGVRDNLDALINRPILIPVYGKVIAAGRNVKYEVVAFAEVAIQSYRLPAQNRITAKFLGFKDCGGPIEEPPPPPVNQPPVVEGQSLNLFQGETIEIILEGSDPDGSSIEFEIVDVPLNGSLKNLGGGLVEYTPKAGFIGEDSFTFRATDGELFSDLATVLLLVACPDENGGDAVFWSRFPASIDGTVEGSIYHLTGQGFNLNSSANISGDILVPGTPNVNVNGTPNWEGVVQGDGSPSPSGYWITINSGATLRNLVTRTDPQPLPDVTAPTAPSNWNWANINNASDPDPNWSQVGSVNFNSNSGVRAVPAGAYGSFNLNNGTGIILGTAGATEPEVYSFQQLNVNSGAQIQVVGPVIVRLANQTSINGPAGAEGKSEWLRIEVNNGGFTANSQGQTIYAHVYAPRGEIIVNNNSTLCGAAFGQRIRVNSGGLLRYCGPIGGGDCGEVNQPPVAEDIEAATVRNEPVEITLLGFDPDGDTITFEIVSEPSNGSVSLNNDVVTYTPTTGFVGTDTFTYLVNDGELDSEIATVTVEVAFANNPPVASNVTATTPMSTPVEITLQGSDPDGDPITYIITQNPTRGQITLDGNIVTYTPNAGFHGTDGFLYRVSDGFAESNQASVVITVTYVNQPPTANPIEATTYVDQPVTVQLSGADVENDPLTFSIVSEPTNGTLELLPGYQVAYTPGPGFEGVDTFTYIANDGELDSVPATVTISVVPVPNLPPVADAKSYTSSPNVPLDIVLSGTDPEGEPLAFFITSAPSNGEIISQDGAFLTYMPDVNFVGSDSFTYIANDGELDSEPATVSIEITSGGNLPPVADAGPDALYGLNFIVDGQGRAVFVLDGVVTDDGMPIGSVLTSNWTLVSSPAGANVEIVDPASPETTVSVSNPQAGFYTFELTADDSVFTDSDQVTIELRILNEPPTVKTARNLQVLGINTPHAITGTVTDDNFPGNPLTTTWRYIHGPTLGDGSPAIPTITSPNTVSTTVSFPATGIYILELEADDLEYTDSDVLIVYVSVPCPIILPSSAVAWWTGKYSIGDFAQRLHDGQYVGDLVYTPGMVSLAWYFNGIDAGVFVPRTGISNVGTSASGFTMEGWVSPDSLHDGTLMQWSAENGTGVTIAVGSAGQLIITLPSTNQSAIALGNSFNNSTTVATVNGFPTATMVVPNVFVPDTEGTILFTHINVTYNRSQGIVFVYRNGGSAPFAALQLGNHAFKANGDIWLGRNAEGTQHYGGVLDEWTLYRAPLSASQNNTIFNAQATGKCPLPPNQ